MSMMPLSVAGGYWTGSSAVVDLLMEHSECSVVPYEFSLFSFGQYFKELYHPMIHGGLDISLAEKNQRRFDSFNQNDFYPFRAILRRVFRKLDLYPAVLFCRRSGIGKILGEEYQSACKELSSLIKQQLKSSEVVSNNEIDVAIRSVLEQAVIAMTPDGNNVVKEQTIIGVFDQIIAPPYEPYCRGVLPDLRCINVDRDWRDQYISIRSAYKSMLSVNDSLDVKPWDEDNSKLKKLDPVNYFVNLRTSIDAVKKQGIENTLWVNFEDLVFERKDTAHKIFKFLGIGIDNWNPDLHFHPESSSKRTRKWLNAKWQSRELDQELQIIAARLGYKE